MLKNAKKHFTDKNAGQIAKTLPSAPRRDRRKDKTKKDATGRVPPVNLTACHRVLGNRLVAKQVRPVLPHIYFSSLIER